MNVTGITFRAYFRNNTDYFKQLVEKNVGEDLIIIPVHINNGSNHILIFSYMM